ncbi:hypothetical protein BKA70DRAFT_1224362 [Coprinopsis sp. MPI-PUGE-AT-0042]|nr:hypothetical protein BKA70DRAFT_1224362 [Coprinopsis sp. MPI-PUGE-AT-0042]
MVDTLTLVRGPAVKVGGRRIPTTVTRQKPQSSVESKAESTVTEDSKNADAAIKSSDDSGEDTNNNEVMRKKRREQKDEKQKTKNDSHRQRKQHTRPTRDAQSNFRAFASQRVVQPNGKAGGA